MVVLKHANVAEAVRAAAFGAMQHQGQICMYVIGSVKKKNRQ